MPLTSLKALTLTSPIQQKNIILWENLQKEAGKKPFPFKARFNKLTILAIPY